MNAPPCRADADPFRKRRTVGQNHATAARDMEGGKRQKQPRARARTNATSRRRVVLARCMKCATQDVNMIVKKSV